MAKHKLLKIALRDTSTSVFTAALFTIDKPGESDWGVYQ